MDVASLNSTSPLFRNMGFDLNLLRVPGFRDPCAMAPKESSATLARGKGVGSHHQHGEQGAPRPDGTTPSSWDGRRFRLRLHSAQRNRPEPEESSWFGLRRSRWHPDPDHRKRNAMMEGFGQAEAVRFTFLKWA